MRRAPRLVRHVRRGFVRGAVLALGLLSAGACAAQITAARYTDPTERYPHAVLGDGIEHAGLEVTLANGQRVKVRWPDTIVFEDTAPRLVDVDNDGSPEVIVVESHEQLGARVAVYRFTGKKLVRYVANEFIGRRFRWLAVVGAADLDGDGAVEIAYVDRPHLAKTLTILRVEALDSSTAVMQPVAQLPGVTNHRIGERDIAGGLRDCGAAPEMIVASADWSRLLAVTLQNGALRARDIGPHQGRSSFAAAMTNC